MQTNLDFKNPLKTICWILSVLSWLLFLVTGWMGFFKLAIVKYKVVTVFGFKAYEYSINNIWSFLNYSYKTLRDGGTELQLGYIPIQSQKIFYIILFGILMIIGTFGFIIYIFKSVFRKDEHVFEGMMGTFSRYHFIPLVCASALFIAGYSHNKNLFDLIISSFSKDDSNKHLKDFSIDLVFSILGLLILIFVKMQTKIENPLYVVYTIKDGVYSCLIALFTYNLFYSSYFIGYLQKIINKLDGEKEDLKKYTKDCGIGFSISMGVINLCVAYGLKDFVLPIINFIIYLGIAINFFDIDEKIRESDDVTNAEGIIDIIMTVLSAAVFAFLVFLKYKKSV